MDERNKIAGCDPVEVFEDCFVKGNERLIIHECITIYIMSQTEYFEDVLNFLLMTVIR